MIPLDQVKPFVPGSTSIAADDLNAMLNAIKTSAISGSNAQTSLVEVFFGKLDATDKTPYTDERYWVKRVYCSTAAGTKDSQIAFTVESGADNPKVMQVTATNLAELGTGTHGIEDASIVVVFALIDYQWPGIKHYYFWTSGGAVTGAVRLAKTQEALQTDGKVSVKFYDGSAEYGSAFDVYARTNQSATTTIADWNCSDTTAALPTARVVLIAKTEGDWYLIQPTMIYSGACP